MSTQVQPVCEPELASEPLDFALGPRAGISEHLIVTATLIGGQTVEMKPRINLRARYPVYVRERTN